MSTELQLGKILVVALYLLPGYIFLFTVSRHCLPGGRLFGGKTMQLLAAVIASTFVFLIFDHSEIRNKIAAKINQIELLQIHLDPASNHLATEPVLTSMLNYLLAPNDKDGLQPKTATKEQKEKGKSKPNQASKEVESLEIAQRYTAYVSYLLRVVLFLVAPFAWIFATLVVCLHAIAETLSRTNPIHILISIFYWTVWTIDSSFGRLGFFRLLRTTAIQTEKFIISQLARLPFNLAAVIIKIYFRIIRLILLLILVPTTILIVASVVIFVAAFIPVELLLYVYYRVLVLFSPPSADTFRTFLYRLQIPILEIRNHSDLLLKGRLLDVLPTSDGQIGSLTITNVMQYSAKRGESLITPGNREVYIFPHFESKLTVSSASIKDFNFWRMPSDSFSAYFKVQSDDELDRQTWYLQLYLRSHRTLFEFPKEWTFSITADLGPRFCARLLQILEENYCPPKSSISPFIFRRKLKKLLKEFSPILRFYLRESRNAMGSFSQDVQSRTIQDRHLAIGTFHRIHRRCKV